MAGDMMSRVDDWIDLKQTFRLLADKPFHINLVVDDGDAKISCDATIEDNPPWVEQAVSACCEAGRLLDDSLMKEIVGAETVTSNLDLPMPRWLWLLKEHHENRLAGHQMNLCEASLISIDCWVLPAVRRPFGRRRCGIYRGHRRGSIDA